MSGTKCNIVFAAHVFEDYKYSVKEEEVNKILPLRRPWRSQLDKTLVGGNPKQLKNNNDIMICNIKSSKNFSQESNAICYQQFIIGIMNRYDISMPTNFELNSNLLTYFL